MADVLEAMGFPSDWCEQALRRCSGGVEPAVELLLQWQADGRAPAVLNDSAAVSSVTTNPAISSASGLDAVVPDAGGAPVRSREPRLKQVQEEESNVRKARSSEDVASGSKPIDNNTQVELQIRCSGYPTIKKTFSAGATLKEVRDFVQQDLQNQQPVGLPPSSGVNRPARRTSRSNGFSANPPISRVTQRAARKTARFADPSSSVLASRGVANGNMYFLIPFPRAVYDTEASMETTLCDANLYPRGVLTVQFQTKVDPLTSAHVNNASEFNGPPGEDVQSSHVEHPTGNHRHVEDVAKRELRLKATLDRYGQVSGREENETVVAAPSVTSSAVAPVAHGREERSLEVDGERVRHRELALQAAAKRMTEAAEMFRQGLVPDAGEAGGGGGFCTPLDPQPVPATTSNDETRFVSEDQDSKGKQVAESGPSSRAGQLAEFRMHDGGNNIAAFRGRATRARVPLPSPSPSRPEKMPRTDEESSTSSVGANHNPPLFASGHAVDRFRRRGEVQESSPSERWIRGSPGSGSSSVSELRIRLEDGSVLRHTFPAYTTLQSICEYALPARLPVAEYGLILPMPGSHFFEGEALSQTLEEVGLVPRGVVHLQKVASRGLVTQGRHRARRMIRYLESYNEPEPELEQLWQDFSRHMNTNLTYEELVELEDSIGRVNVGVPEATIANLPTHTVSRSTGDICIVCLSEMVEGEEVMLLPCLHTFHPACIRQWLLQSTCCPTCKHFIT